MRIGNILSNGFLNPDLSEYVLIDPKVSQLFPRTKLELYDILMAVRGDGSTAKRIGMVTSKNLVGANISPNLLRFQAKQETVTPIYLFYFMTSKGGQTLLERYVTRTAKKTITAQAIKTISICLPPYSLQQKFDKLVKTTWQMKQNVDKTSWESSRFFNALVQRAFRGEL
ncbi:restriction endonuclease subunit S [Candidatus Poribacteria bacterium]|nr:restriction endonuclease subunit S [Candidatus Poribacteria bacterium]